jgi:hypothetical protein
VVHEREPGSGPWRRYMAPKDDMRGRPSIFIFVSVRNVHRPSIVTASPKRVRTCSMELSEGERVMMVPGEDAIHAIPYR